MITIKSKKQHARGSKLELIESAMKFGKALRSALAACAFALLLAPSLFATQLEVGTGQAYATMQACMNSAVSGDICNVHAGTYTESVSFQANSVTLQVNSGDTVILNGTIDMASHANDIVDGFQITGFSVSSNGGIHASGTTGGIIRNNTVHDATGTGIYVINVSNFQIYGNTVHDMAGPCCISDGDGIATYNTNSTDATYAHGIQIYNNTVYQNHQDGIEINGAWGMVYGNYVHDNIYSNFASTHPDGIECNSVANGSNGCIHYLIFNNTVKNQSQNIYLTSNGTSAQLGDIWIFNNIVYNDATSSTGVNMTSGSMCCNININSGTTAYILSNTLGGSVALFDILVGDGSGGNNSSMAFSGVTIKNNIITNSGYIGLWTYPSSNVVAMDNNIYYNNSTAMLHWGTSGNLNSITSVRSATGMEASGQSSNPLINAFPTPTLQSSSPALSAGANLTSLGQAFLDSDKNGTARPSSGAWDIGAFSSGSAVARPNPPTNVTAKAN
jgi:parallel beta-helix repeat protein